MPEIPDLEYIRDTLKARLIGATVVSLRMYQPLVLRLMIRDDAESILKGKQLTGCERRGAFLRLSFSGGISLICNFMLTGRFALNESPEGKAPRKKRPKSVCLVIEFGENIELTYDDSKKMGKLYLVDDANQAKIPGWESVGINPISAEFTLSAFTKLVERNRSQVKSLLLKESIIGGIGNAYADEILFEAGLHPKSLCAKLDEDAINLWHSAIKKVLKNACKEVRLRSEKIDVKVRDFLKVRNRAGEPCSKCGTTIRRAGVRGFDAFFCPKCQPVSRKTFIDWMNTK